MTPNPRLRDVKGQMDGREDRRPLEEGTDNDRPRPRANKGGAIKKRDF